MSVIMCVYSVFTYTYISTYAYTIDSCMQCTDLLRKKQTKREEKLLMLLSITYIYVHGYVPMRIYVDVYIHKNVL